MYYSDANLSAPAFVERRLDEVVHRLASWRRTNRLLDIGCGAGALLDAATRAGWLAEGTEISETAVQSARSRGLNVFYGSLIDAQLPSEQYDVVTAVELLEHLLDPLALLVEVRRILRAGGLLWVTTPHGRGISARLLGTAWSVVSPPEHIQLFSVSGLRRLLRRAGFASMRIAAEGVNPIEIVRHLKGRSIAASERVATSYALNERFTSNTGGRFIKSVINAVLSGSRSGDALKADAVKAP